MFIFLSLIQWPKNNFENFKNLWWKTQKTHFWGTKPHKKPRSHNPIGLVRELDQVDVGLHLCTEFHQNRMIFTRVIVVTDTYINI